MSFRERATLCTRKPWFPDHCWRRPHLCETNNLAVTGQHIRRTMLCSIPCSRLLQYSSYTRYGLTICYRTQQAESVRAFTRRRPAVGVRMRRPCHVPFHVAWWSVIWQVPRRPIASPLRPRLQPPLMAARQQPRQPLQQQRLQAAPRPGAVARPRIEAQQTHSSSAPSKLAAVMLPSEPCSAALPPIQLMLAGHADT